MVASSCKRIPTAWMLSRLNNSTQVLCLYVAYLPTYEEVAQILPSIGSLRNLTCFTMPSNFGIKTDDRLAILRIKAVFASTSLTKLTMDIEVSDEAGHPGSEEGRYRCLDKAFCPNLIDLTLLCASPDSFVRLPVGRVICRQLNLPLLQKLSIGYARTWHPDRIREFIDADLIATYNRHTNLTHLSISTQYKQCPCYHPYETPIEVGALAKLKLSKLVELKLEYHRCEGLSDPDILSKIRTGCPNINRLKIN